MLNVMAPELYKDKSTAPVVDHIVQPTPAPAVMLLTPKFQTTFGSGVELNAAVATNGSVESFTTWYSLSVLPSSRSWPPK